MDRLSGAPRIVATWAALAGLATPGCGAQEPGFDGTYSVAYAGGHITLALRTAPSGDVEGWARGVDGSTYEVRGRVEIDEDGDAAVEGSLAGAAGQSDFTLYPEDDGAYGLLLIPYDGAGTPRSELAAVYRAVRAAGVPGEMNQAGIAPGPVAAAGAAIPGATPGDAPGAAAAGVSRDPRLVGVWAAQVIMNSPAGSIATEVRMQIRGDGVLADLGSRALGSVGGGAFDTGQEGGGEQAVWRTGDGILWIAYGGSAWVPFARFELSGDRLLLTYLQDGSRQLWNRAR